MAWAWRAAQWLGGTSLPGGTLLPGIVPTGVSVVKAQPCKLPLQVLGTHRDSPGGLGPPLSPERCRV